MPRGDGIRPVRRAQDVLADWAPDLALKLGRPEGDIRAKGLSVDDFSPGCDVEVRYPYGLTHRVSLAFAVIRPETNEAAVFSEHAGYLEFDLIEDCEIVETDQTFYRHEHGDHG